MKFIDRTDAGLQLANKLCRQSDINQLDPEQLLVLSIPRGGVILGDIVARMLHCQHDVLIVKKIGLPRYEESAIGAIAENGTISLNRRMVLRYGLKSDEIKHAIAKAHDKVQQYEQTLRHRSRMEITDKTIILVDDGVATGETIKVAIHYLRHETQKARKVIVAVPVGSPHTLSELITLVDRVICLYTPDNFVAVGQYYQQFDPISDDEVLAILEKQTT